MESDIQGKREKEKEVVSWMIQIYCRKKHGMKTGLCQDCATLAAYACARSEQCPFMNEKTFCSNCRVHCYKPEMRKKIRAVMRFSGPRMLFYHPVMAIKHVISTKAEVKRLKRTKGVQEEA